MISHHISLLCRLHAKFQIPTHPFKCHTVALKTVLTDLDWCRLSTLIFFHHILNVAFCYIVLLQLSHCVFSASFVAVENDLAWELRGFLFFFETTAHKQQNNCGAFIDGEELEPEVLSVLVAPRGSQFVGRSSPARLNCFASRHSKIQDTLSPHDGPPCAPVPN